MLSALGSKLSVIDALRPPPLRLAALCRKVREDSRPERIEMDVAHQLQKVRVFLTENGLVAVLEEIAVSPVSAIEAHHVAREQPRHHGGERSSSCSQKKVNMVGEQRPAVAGSRGLDKDPSQTIKEILPVGIIPEDLPPLDASD